MAAKQISNLFSTPTMNENSIENSDEKKNFDTHIIEAYRVGNHF